MCTENFAAGIVGFRGYFSRRKERSGVSLTLCKRKKGGSRNVAGEGVAILHDLDLRSEEQAEGKISHSTFLFFAIVVFL
jgi:hypothetical protein